MTIDVEGPDGVTVQFPDGTSPDVMTKAMAAKFGGPQAAAPQGPQQMEGIGRLPAMAGSGVAKGALGTLGLPGDFLGMVNRNADEYLFNKPEMLISSALNYARGGKFEPSDDTMARVNKARAYWAKPHVMGSESFQGVAKQAGIVDRPDLQPQGTGERYLKAGAEGVGSALPLLPFAAPGRALETVAAGLGGALGSEGGGDVAETLGAEPGSLPHTLARVAGSVAAGVGTAATAAKAKNALTAQKIVPPSTDDLAAMASRTYQQAENAGLVIVPDKVTGIADDIAAAVKEAGFHPRIHTKVAAALDELATAKDTPQTLKQMDLLRRIAGSAAKSIEPDERRIASILIDKLDDQLANLTARDVVSGNAQQAVDALTSARGLWARMRKSDLLETAVETAKNRAGATGSGGNVDNAIRQEFRKILDSPKLSRGFSDEELAAIKQVVNGTASRNALRLLGKLSPQGSGLMAMLGIGGTMANPALGVAPLAGAVAKPLADRATMRAAADVASLVRAGGPLNAPLPPAPGIGLPAFFALTNPQTRRGLLGAPGE